MRILALLVLTLLLSACVSSGPTGTTGPNAPPTPEAGSGAMELRSSAFQPGQPIPTKYSCDGQSIPPPLSFNPVPAGATHLALLVWDPDAPSGTVTHWTWWNVPAEHHDLPEGVKVSDVGGTEGQAYRGMCPPAPPAHRYFFHGYALEGPISPASGSLDDVRKAVTGHVKAEDEMFGTYMRPALPQ